MNGEIKIMDAANGKTVNLVIHATMDKDTLRKIMANVIMACGVTAGEIGTEYGRGTVRELDDAIAPKKAKAVKK